MNAKERLSCAISKNLKAACEDLQRAEKVAHWGDAGKSLFIAHRACSSLRTAERQIAKFEKTYLP